MKLNNVSVQKQSAPWICIIVLLLNSSATQKTIVVDGFTNIDEVSEFAHYYQGHLSSKNDVTVKSVNFRQTDSKKIVLGKSIFAVGVEQFKKNW